jgi:RNA polymerase sigma-70 factor (ECF subfamily)
MNVDSLEELLDKLNSGDHDAAAQAFTAYEPYLRKVVRRLLPAQLQAKFDSIDVVQSVHCDVLMAFRAGGMRFNTVAQLRAFLIRATKNRFIDRVRQYQTSARLERSIEDSDPPQLSAVCPEPRPSESAAATELWERLLGLCPPEHHRLLHLRRLGASAGEIAAQVDLHEGSVRRILRELSLRLAHSYIGSARATGPEARTP